MRRSGFEPESSPFRRNLFDDLSRKVSWQGEVLTRLDYRRRIYQRLSIAIMTKPNTAIKNMPIKYLKLIGDTPC